ALVVKQDTFIVSNSSASALVERLTATNEVTLEVWMTPANVQQDGPARIISMGEGTKLRNFTLGQDATNLAVRLQTTGNDGHRATVGDAGVIELRWDAGRGLEGLHHVVFTRDAAGERVLWFDG